MLAFAATAACASTTVATGPWQFKSAEWKPGVYEWKGMGFPIAPAVTDWRGYDRLSVDLVNDGDGGDRLYVFVSSPDTPSQSKFTANTATPGHRFRRWVVSLENMPAEVCISNVTSIGFSSRRGTSQNLLISNIRLLRKGEDSGGGTFTEAPPDNPAMAGAVRAAVSAWELERAQVHAAALGRFERQCRSAGTEKDGVLFGRASSMCRVMPRDDFAAEPATSLSVGLARNEKESVQVLVASRVDDLSDVRVAVSDLVSDSGAVFSRTNVSCCAMGYCDMKVAPDYSFWRTQKSPSNTLFRTSLHPVLGWYPDPILEFLGSAAVLKGDVQSFWLRVRCPSGQERGTYRGVARVACRKAGGGRVVQDIPMSVRVYGFGLPSTPPVPMSISFKPSVRGPKVRADNMADDYYENERRMMGDPLNSARLARGRTRDWANFLADNLITIDFLYPSVGPRWDELVELKRQGRLDHFNLCYWNHKSDLAPGSKFIEGIRSRYEKARSLGLLGHAVLYGMDEIRSKYFEEGRVAIAALKREFPDVPLVTTSVDLALGCGSPLSGIDVFVPLTVTYNPAQAEKSRREGRKVGWYVCAGSDDLRPQFFFARNPIESRHMMGATAVKYKPDWFLYYEIAIWDSDRPIESGPFTDWSPESYRTWSGDGCLVACGPGGTPLSTIRLENFRDGLEDLHYAKLLEKRLAERPGAPWAARARSLLAVPDDVVASLAAFTDDAHAYQSWRDALADVLEQALELEKH